MMLVVMMMTIKMIMMIYDEDRLIIPAITLSSAMSKSSASASAVA